MTKLGVPIAASRPCRVCSAPVFAEQRFCGECGAGVALEFGGDEQEAEGGVADPLVGRVVADRYRMIRCIGRGGMGVVYEVEHVHIGKRLAMKLLHGDLAGNPATIRRLRREAEAASRLSDSSTVQVFDFGTSDGLAYLVMELVEGEDLGQILRKEGRIPFARIARLVVDVCGSLAEAHSIGIVHRDLKPENVMIVRGSMGERAKVLDFGLAMLRASANQSVSRTGSIVGTPHYMAPEQIRAEDVDARADIYALGGVLYRGVVGTPPFTGESAIVVLTKHMNEAVVAPSARVPNIEPGVDAIVLRCLAKSPRDRYESVEELAADLERWLRDRGLLEESHRRDVTATNRVDAIATRRDVDSYEARLRRRGRTTTLLTIFGSVAVAVAIAFAAFQTAAPPAAPTREIEPNQTPQLATNLVRGRPLFGQLGRRMDTARGDIDVYRLVRSADASRESIRARVTAIPNIDLVLELFREGVEDPLMRVDAGGVGSEEGFAGFPIGSGSYLLVVREHWVSGRYPIENVSDSYGVEWDVVADEGELDDSVQTARHLDADVVLRGRIGWKDDVDVVCVDAGSRGRITVTPARGANVSIGAATNDALEPGALVVDAALVVDVAGDGGAETWTLPPDAANPCVRIARVEPADRSATEARSYDAPYGVLFVRTP